MRNVDLLVILGPTASGKTRLAVHLARHLSGEVISADSRQVYRGMDIGTGKDLAEYGDTPCHLIDVLDPAEEFSLFKFQQLFHAAFDDIRGRGRLPVLCGGTGLYLEAVLKGYELLEVPENPLLRAELAGQPLETLTKRLRACSDRLHNTTDLIDRCRLMRAIEIAEFRVGHAPVPLPELKPCIFGMRWPREILRRRITMRLKERLAQGMIEEVERLHATGITWERLDFFGLEYRFIARYLRGELQRNDMVQKLNSAIHDFAKRQETWFRRMERNGTTIHWLDGAGNPEAEALRVLEAEYR